jgi:hypothetical protein
MMGNSMDENVYSATELEDSEHFCFSSARRPSEVALRKESKPRLRRAAQLGDTPPTKEGRAEAVALCEDLQALYLLVCASGYRTVRFRLAFRAAVDRLAVQLGADAEHFFEVSEFAGDDHRSRVVSRARDFERKLEPAPMPEPKSLSPDARARMLTAFSGVRYHGGEVFLEPGFAMQMLRMWNKPLLSNTAHAVETLHMLHRLDEDVSAAAARALEAGTQASNDTRQPRTPTPKPFSVSDGVLAFVERQYDSRGCFIDSVDSGQILYATSCGVAVYKAAQDKDCSERFMLQRELERLFPQDPKRYRKIRDWAVGRFRELLASGTGTMIEFNHAVRILWNLSGDLDGGVEALLRSERSALLAFLKDSIRKIPLEDGRQLTAFATAPSSKPACLTACLAAARLAQHTKLQDAELNASLNECAEYVAACQSPGSGFGSSIHHVPDILHTYLAVSFLLERNKSVLDKELPNIINFAAQCRKDGGYAIVPELTPSAYGTRLGLQIFRRLELSVPDTAEMRDFIMKLRITDGGVDRASRESSYLGDRRPTEAVLH